MKITNKLNLPSVLQRAVQKDYQYQEKRYSITSLLDPERVLMLKRKYNDQIEQDIVDCIFMLFGSFTHYALENITLKENEYVEKKMEHTFDNGYTLSGVVDHIEPNLIDDYKTTSVWSVIYRSDDEKWLKQLQMGAYLFYKETGIWINKGRIIAILKDWSKKDITKDKYPQYPVEVIEFDLGKPEEIEKWILAKFKRLAYLEEEQYYPMCTEKERFVNKKKEDVRCLSYCSVNKFCPYYQKEYLKKEGVENV